MKSSRSENKRIHIRNCSGIPVIEVVGELNRAVLKAMESTIAALASAGHYHIVLNIQRAVGANIRILGALKGTASRVVRHYGAIDVVAEAGQISQLLRLDKLARLFRFCTSETEAFRRIKRLSRPPEPSGQDCSAHIMEAK